MSISTITQARTYILSPAFLLHNPDFEHERGLLTTGKLDVVNVSRPPGTPHGVKAVAQMANPAGVMQIAQVDVREADVWYRAMPRSEYLYLKRFGKVAQDASYGAVTTSATHSMSTMGNRTGNTHMIEFDLRGHTSNLYNQLRSAVQSAGGAMQEPITEADGDTFGLGVTGHYAGQAGKLFNELLAQGSWRLVLVHLLLH